MCDFDKEDAGDFIVDEVSADQGKYVEFDGTMHLKTEYEVKTENSLSLPSGSFINETEKMNMNEFKKVSDISFEGIQSEIVPPISNYTKITLANAKKIAGAVTKISNMKWKLSGSDGNTFVSFELGGISSTSKTCALRFKLASDALLGANSRIGVVHANSSTRDLIYIILTRPKIEAEYIVVFNPRNDKEVVFEDGIRLKKNIEYSCASYQNPASTTFKNNWCLAFSVTGTFSFDSIDVALNIPDLYDIKHINLLYRKDDSIFAVTNDVFGEISRNSLLQDTETLFSQTPERLPTISEFAGLGDFSVINRSTRLLNIKLTAVPKDQLIFPKGLITIESFEGIDKAVITLNITANAICKLLVTTDLSIYQTYDTVNQVWQVVDYTNLSDIATLGIDAAQLSNIPRTAWDTFIKGKSGIGFAYLLSMEDTTDACNIDKLELLVDMKGEWNKVDIK